MIERINLLNRAEQKKPENPRKKNFVKGLAAIALALAYFFTGGFDLSSHVQANQVDGFKCNGRVMTAIESNRDGTALPVLIQFSPKGKVELTKKFSENYPALVGQAGYVEMGPNCAVLFDLTQEKENSPEIWEWTPDGLKKILSSKEITLGLLFGARSFDPGQFDRKPWLREDQRGWERELPFEINDIDYWRSPDTFIYAVETLNSDSYLYLFDGTRISRYMSGKETDVSKEGTFTSSWSGSLSYSEPATGWIFPMFGTPNLRGHHPEICPQGLLYIGLNEVGVPVIFKTRIDFTDYSQLRGTEFTEDFSCGPQGIVLQKQGKLYWYKERVPDSSQALLEPITFDGNLSQPDFNNP